MKRSKAMAMADEAPSVPTGYSGTTNTGNGGKAGGDACTFRATRKVLYWSYGEAMLIAENRLAVGLGTPAA